MTRRKKRVAAALAALMLTMSLTVPGLALGEIDTTQAGSVTLTVPEGYAEDLALATVDVKIYKVATVDSNGVFTLTENFAALSEQTEWTGILGTDQQELEDLWEAASALVNAYTEDAETPEGEPEATPEPGAEPTPEATAIEPDATAEGVPLDGSGKISLDSEELGLGLYLLVPEKVQTQLYEYTFSSILLSVPMVEHGEDGDAWIYDVTVNMKGKQESRLTSINIEKSLITYNETLGPATFVFEIVAVDEETGEVVYSNVVSVTFDGPGTKSVTVEGIPVGSKVTVTELDTGNSYQVQGGDTVEIESLPLADEVNGMNRIPFTNDYDGHRIPDPSVKNVFVYDGNGWVWQGESEEAEG